MTSQDLLIARIKQLSEEEISTLLNATSVMLEKHGASSKPDCPYCGSQNIIRYGHKCNKQRLWKSRQLDIRIYRKRFKSF